MPESDGRETLRSKTLDRISDPVVGLDTDLTYTFANPQAERLLDTTEESLRGTHIRDAFPDGEDTVVERNVTTALETGQKQTFERRIETCGRLFEVRVYPDEDGVSVCFIDIPGRTERELERDERNSKTAVQVHVLESFIEIATDVERSSHQQITDLLDLGATYLDLDIGILSEINGSEYTVRNAVNPPATVEPGDTFELSDTYCSLVYDADGPVSFHSAGDAGVKDHPAYQQQGIESYIGVPVRISGERYGTLNFSRPESRSDPIVETEESFVRILAQWIGMELERQQRKREMERTSEFLRETQEVARIGGWEFDLQSETLRWSDEVYRIHGVAPNVDPTADDAIEFYHPEDRDSMREVFDRLITDGEPYDLELRIVTTDDDVRWVRTRGEPRYEDDDIVAVQGTFQDVTERKEYQRDLEHSQQIIENATDIATIIDTDGLITYVSPAVENVLGYAPYELIGTDGFEYQSAETTEAVAAAIEHVLDNPAETKTVQTRFRRADGSWCWVESTLRNRLADPAIDGILVSSRDITERKEREQELKRHERLLDTLFEFIPVHLFVKDDQVRHLWVSAALVDDPEQYLGKRDVDVADGASDDFSAEATGDDRRVVNDEERIIDKEEYNEELDKWFLTSKVPWYDEDGSVAGLLGYSVEITDRKDYQRELEQQNERLDEFANVISHDLRNPLTVAQARAGILQKESGDEFREYLDTLVNALERMERIIEDTLTLARQGDTVGAMTAIPVVDLVGKCWAGVETAEATLEIDDDSTVRGDRNRLRHVFENLIRNAVEHGGEDVTVRVGRAGEECLYIEDDGPGIPADDRDGVFEPGHTSATGGTGFGLTIIKRIAEAHGWNVTITDGSDGGARFEFANVELLDQHRE